MECKDIIAVCLSASEQGINRNIMECKDGTDDGTLRIVWVLIETLWNVKKGTKERIEKLGLY